ncbi:MAG: hypothetical protein FWG35_08035 [Spirochaetaceae bacterium]|nr:hypothetical protein [Spirochaetaceae bacterium]
MRIRTVLVILAAGVLLAGCVSPRYGAAVDEKSSQQLVRETVLGAGGEPAETREFTYSPAGELVEEKLFDAAGRVREISSSSYQDGRRVERASYAASGELTGRRTYTYTTKGLTETECYFDGAGKLLLVSRFRYNYWGDTIDWVTTDAEGRLVASTRYTYEKGRPRTMRLTGALGNETIVELSYDADGRKTRAAYTGAAGNTEKEIAFRYDERGRLAGEEIFSAFGTLIGKTVYAYTENGRQPEKIYRYDGRGNPRETVIQEFALRGAAEPSL